MRYKEFEKQRVPRNSNKRKFLLGQSPSKGGPKKRGSPLLVEKIQFMGNTENSITDLSFPSITY